MTFPMIKYKFNGFVEAQALTDVMEQKCEALEKYFHGANSVQCEVEFEKIAPQKNGQIHHVSVGLLVDGTPFWAEATNESFEKAIDEVRNELDIELRKAKEKSETLKKQGGREVKDKLLSAE